MKTKLAAFNNRNYHPGRSACIQMIWYVLHAVFIRSSFPINSFKISLLRIFGARIGKNVVIKPHVHVKYPWNISIGDNSWIGEEVWLDSLGTITIGNDCCISQGAKIITGNHDYTKTSFDLIIHSIVIEDGVWIGCAAVVCGNIICRTESVLTAGSVASRTMEANIVYRGNPALPVRERYQKENPLHVLTKKTAGGKL